MSDSPRRRRSDDDSGQGGGGLPLFPLILIVIFAGLLLGGVLAHFFGAAGTSPKSTPAALALASPQSSPSPLELPSPGRSPLPSPTARTSPKPSLRASASPSAPASATPSPKPLAPKTPSPTEKPRAVVTAAPATPSRAAAVTPAPNYVASGPDQAAEIVRSYLGAIARGDRATATSYLARGLPGEVFMDSASRIVSVHSSAAGASQYKATADVQTSTGEYHVTFALEPGPGGLQITDHYAIKVH
ncbi:MAG: hypothetical protein ABI231_07675 [Candidatus Tumulicola sp.]